MDKSFEIPILKCLRCGHTWIPRQPKESESCPMCRSPYWNKPKWKGDKEMTQSMFNQLYPILVDLSADCQHSIEPNQVILELTKEGSRYHFRVPNSSRKQIIGFGNFRLSRSDKFNKNQPCAIVSISAVLLNDQDPQYIKNHHSNASYGRPHGEVAVAVCQVGDNDYKLALKALIEAANNLLSGKTYKW